MTTLSRLFRYYALYAVSPIFALAAGTIVNHPEPWVQATVVAIAFLFWWVLSVLHEENQRAIDLWETL